MASLNSDGMAEQIIPASQQASSNRLLLLVTFVAGTISVVALIIAVISLSSHNHGTATAVNVGTNTGAASDDKIWTFAIGHDGTNLEYIEDTTGTLREFHVDIVNAGWFNTYDRALTVDFTSAFRRPLLGVFYVKNNNPYGFQWTDVTGKKIGFVDGWANDEHCLARMGDKITGVPLETSQIIHYSAIEAAVEAVNNGDVAALFANTNQDYRDLQKVSDELLCTKDGGCMMFRKDTLLADWWNLAFESLKGTTYRDICAKVDKEHGAQPGAGGDVICVD